MKGRISTLLQTPRSVPLYRTGYRTYATSFTTINAAEIEHFSSLSSQWWDPAGEFKLLHRMNPTRVAYIRDKVALDRSIEPEWKFETRHQDELRQGQLGTGRWLTGKRCLDVGCGGGLLSESLARLGADTIGIDASESNIAIATLHASKDPFLPFNKDGNVPGSLTYKHTPAESLRDQGEQFDVVCAMEILEHVDQPGEFMKCLGDMVKPGGHLIMSTISRTPLSQLLTLTLAEDVLRLVTRGTHTYKKFVKPEELKRFVYQEMGGFKTWERNYDAGDTSLDQVGETRGIVYDPIKGEWRLWGGAQGTWTKSAGELCNYMFHAKKRA